MLNAAMRQLGASKDQNSVVNVWISPDAHYAFVEFRSVEEATFALNQLNGYQVGGYVLRLGRTKGNLGLFGNEVTTQGNPFIGTLGSSSLPVLGSTAATAEPLSDVVMVANLPSLLDEGHIKELFTPFGEVRNCCLFSFNFHSSFSLVESLQLDQIGHRPRTIGGF